MDRGFRTGIAHLDAYGIDAGVFATGNDRQPRRLHHLFIHADTGHENSCVLLCGTYHVYTHCTILWITLDIRLT
ncbi:hypothetical protein D3C84_962930 [compost metagenome]